MRIGRVGRMVLAVVVVMGVEGMVVSRGMGETLSPGVSEALKGLSAEDFGAREKALKKLQLALGEQVKALLSTDDPESQTRLVELMEFNDGLCRWAIDVLKMPEEGRKGQLAWGLAEKNLGLIAKAYSPNTAKRLEAVKELGEDESEAATVALGRLLDDENRAVYLAAMEAVWDRKPTEAIVNSLWNRAVEAPLAVYGGVTMRGGGAAAIVFRGKNLGMVYDGAMRRVQDGGPAAEVLMNMKPAQLEGKLKGLFERAEQQMSGDNAAGAGAGRMWAFMSSNEAMRNAYQLAELYKSKELVGPMVRLATGKSLSKSNGAINAEKYFWTNRTAPLAAALLISGQEPADYKLKKMPQAGNMWVVPTEADENAAVEKLDAWWKKNAEKYGGKAEGAASQPGEGAGG